MAETCTCLEGSNLVEIGGAYFCEHIESVPPSCSPISCPDGYTYDEEADICVSQYTTNNLCPSGSVYDSVAHTCTEIVEYPANCTCLADVTAAPQTVCSGDNAEIALTSTVPGITYSWIVAQTGVTGASAGSGSSNTIIQTLYTTTGGTATYTITPYEAEGCAGQSIQVVVTVNAKPNIIATPNTPQTIASGGVVSTTLSSAVSGTTFVWTVTAPGTITGATAGSGTTISNTLTASQAGAVTYHITATAPNGCTNTLEYVVNVTAVPSCPDRRVAFQICNSNASRDDNFDIFLNGTYIGAVDLSTDAQVGSVFIADLNIAHVITSADFVCPIGSMQVYRFDPSLLSTTNTIFMQNTQNNGNGNAGTIGVRNYLLTGNNLSDPCTIADLSYGPPPGGNATLTFAYTSCCSEDLPT